MRLWVGLGNPEPGMARNRHNVGFMALDVIAAHHGFTPWRPRFKGLISEGSLGGEKILALKPQTYMNDFRQQRSGCRIVLQTAARGDHRLPRRTGPRTGEGTRETRRRRGWT